MLRDYTRFCNVGVVDCGDRGGDMFDSVNSHRLSVEEHVTYIRKDKNSDKNLMKNYMTCFK